MASTSIDRTTFFKTYNLEEDVLDKTGLVWADLEAIYADHLSNTQTLESTADYVAARLRQVNEVHSLKIRIKDPEHLIEKIIRKKSDDPSLEFTLDNYREKVTDLIGVRALHLFKEDWSEIHDFIARTWQLYEKPTANVRKGDSEEYTQQFVEKGCRINEHKFGYRSVHYLLVSQPAKEQYITEVQVRTIFEEGWSEIDHRIRYPYDLGNAVLTQLSAIHNRLAGSADEIGSFIKFLKKELRTREEQFSQAIEKHDKTVAELNDYFQKLEISNKEKKELEQRVRSLTSGTRINTLAGDISGFQQAIGKALATIIASGAMTQRAQIASGIQALNAIDAAKSIAAASVKPPVLTMAKSTVASTVSPANVEGKVQKEQKTSQVPASGDELQGTSLKSGRKSPKKNIK